MYNLNDTVGEKLAQAFDQLPPGKKESSCWATPRAWPLWRGRSRRRRRRRKRRHEDGRARGENHLIRRFAPPSP